MNINRNRRYLVTKVHTTSSPGVPFVMRWKSGPLARSNDILVLNGFVNTIVWDHNQSDLSDLTLSMRRVTGSPWIADFRSWTWPEVAIPVANQNDRGLWERDWSAQEIRTGQVPSDHQSDLSRIFWQPFIVVILPIHLFCVNINSSLFIYSCNKIKLCNNPRYVEGRTSANYSPSCIVM